MEPTGPSPPRPPATVALCTTGRRASLHACLAALRPVAGRGVEVLVVENGRRRRVPASVIDAVGARLVHEPVRGLDVARNRALREAAAPIVAYVDDDAVITEGWLDALLEPFADPAVALVTGRVTATSTANRYQQAFERRFSFDRGPAPRTVGPGTRDVVDPVYPWQVGTGCNMAVRRSAVLALGGFDEALDMGTPIGGGGDVELFGRVLGAGGTAVYTPAAVVRHEHRAGAVGAHRQFFGYGAAYGAVAFTRVLHGPGRALAGRAYARALRHRIERAAVGDDRTPPSLAVAEVAGQLLGPPAYLLSRALDRRRRVRLAHSRR